MRPKLPNFITEREDPKNKPNQSGIEEPPSQLQTMCLAEQTTEADYKLVRYCKFYMALQANEILKETPVPEICRKFGGCPRGTIQTVQQQAQNFAGMMGAFCERLGWTDYSALFLRISDKINWQVKEDLLELMQIPSLRPERARALYAADITTIEKVTEVREVHQLVSVFMKGDGFVSHRRSNAEELQFKYEYLYTLAAKVQSEAQQIRIK